ncbi:orotate phosphoribosyltransferase [Bacillus coahuilensis p1.1.43]|uniref:Orotate phosphoribosyltransferase n=1 Tax=Bacillus coahuilensis p1.1.43 TaxID=1150625 RepID=A0A147K9E1_9BACI|nr:orotate phosphoribosyltransferase [Bacillus coahuilensis]KUP07046.1 orotate phosphoribosyltransferase [Bacillus coahuilensis p1.1.43]
MRKSIAKHLLDIRAVSLQTTEPYTWSSGMKSPIYCDNRLTLSYPKVREVIATGLVDKIEKIFPEAEMISGTATAGIPHAAWVSDRLRLPMCYVRSKAKGHGKGSQIEGRVNEGQKVVVIEDLISTGGSVLTAVKALKEAGCEVIGVVAIFTYGFKQAEALLEQEGIKWETLTDYQTLLEVAAKENVITEAEFANLESWSKAPEAWGKLPN